MAIAASEAPEAAALEYRERAAAPQRASRVLLSNEISKFDAVAKALQISCYRA
jgi:hypothetical protein